MTEFSLQGAFNTVLVWGIPHRLECLLRSFVCLCFLCNWHGRSFALLKMITISVAVTGRMAHWANVAIWRVNLVRVHVPD